MMGRQDLVFRTCPDCNGSGKSRKKRTNPCSLCRGTGKAEYCETCGEIMPCPGTDPQMFDQVRCLLEL
jgi:RecJ-like exonuclease